MKSDMVEKRILEVDGEVLEGLIAVGQYAREEGVVDVPGLNKTIKVKNGVTVIPEVPFTFKIRRNSKTLKFLQDWKDLNECRDCTMIITDGSGNEINRELWPNTECSRIAGPAYDAASPVIAQKEIVLLPGDIIPISAE